MATAKKKATTSEYLANTATAGKDSTEKNSKKKLVPSSGKATAAVVVEKKKVTKKPLENKTLETNTSKVKPVLQINFFLRFYTNPGQNLFITGSHPLLGGDDVDKALPLQYFNNEGWTLRLDFSVGQLPT